jgi:hypothetical protein
MRVADKGGQKAEFTAGDDNRLVVLKQYASGQIQLVVSKTDALPTLYRRSRWHSVATSQHGFDPGREFAG